jgi:methyl halide transferase
MSIRNQWPRFVRQVIHTHKYRAVRAYSTSFPCKKSLPASSSYTGLDSKGKKILSEEDKQRQKILDMINAEAPEGSIDETVHPRWSAIWDAGLKIGDAFDTGTPSPCLLDQIKKGSVPAGRALVPGCGRGYDVYALASPDRIAVGVELSAGAVAAAQAFQYPCTTPENAQFKQGNFFELDPQDKYDFIYDYTFLCALDPSVRSDWARQMGALVKPGGVLLTLVFPICEKIGGPPFAVNLALVEELLMTGEQAGKWQKEVLEILLPELCHVGRDGVPVPSGFVRPGMVAGGSAFSGIGRWTRL